MDPYDNNFEDEYDDYDQSDYYDEDEEDIYWDELAHNVVNMNLHIPIFCQGLMGPCGALHGLVMPTLTLL